MNESLGMRKRGHRVIIIAQDDSTILKKARESGLEAISLSFRKKDYPKTFLGLMRAIKALKPDVINTHSSRDSWLATLASKASRHGSIVIRTRHISTPVAANWTSSLIYGKLPDMVVTTAEAIREALITSNRVEPGRVVSIPTGIDTKAFDPACPRPDLRAELGLPAATQLVGMVSVLRSWKGHDYFIEAAALLAVRFPGARFIIAGDGPRKAALARMIGEKGLGDMVIMVGHREDVPTVLSSLDVFVQPSYANEGVPQSVLQAMAMKVPVVATDLKPFRELITDNATGLLVPVRDAEGLANKIALLLNDRGLGARLSERARGLVVERFSIERMLDSTERLYASMLRANA